MKPGRPALPATPVVGEAAAAQPGQGGAPDNGGDWLAEITGRPAPQPADGVPVATRGRGDTRRGRATESKRGQRHG